MYRGSHQMSPVAKSPLSGDRLFFFRDSFRGSPEFRSHKIKKNFDRLV